MEQVKPVPHSVWAHHAKMRAGYPWQLSKHGLYSMYKAVHVAQLPVRIRARCFAWPAVGLPDGYRIGSTHFPGPPIDSMAWHDGVLTVCSLQTGWAYSADWVPVGRFLCVSGPVDVRGTVHGTTPVQALPYPCTQIIQSATRIAAWHTSGHVAIFSVRVALLAVVDTNTSSPRHMSVIGDIVCVAGHKWKDKVCAGKCPRDARTINGTSYLLI